MATVDDDVEVVHPLLLPTFTQSLNPFVIGELVTTNIN